MGHSATPTAALRGRPREFDVGEAVRDAMDVFWTRGYHATSLRDLLDATGLSRGSLYQAFGDKRSLFLKALEHYAEAGLAELDNTLSAPGPVKDVLRAALGLHAALSVGQAGRRGCMMVAAAAELLPHEPDVAAIVARNFRRIQSLLAEAVRRGQACGEIGAEQDARDVARFLTCQIEGMRVLGKAGATRAEMAALAETALRVLG